MPPTLRSNKKVPPKRQTRLTFTPIPSSTPPSIAHSPDTYIRPVAHVRYDSSPLSKKVDSKPQLAIMNSSSPSASKNSQLFILSSSDDESIRGPCSARKRPVVETQSRKSYDSDSEDIVSSSPAKRRRRSAPSALAKAAHEEPVQVSDSDLAEDLANLQDSDAELKSTRTRGRPSESAIKLRRKQQLEALRRRRAGEKEGEEGGDDAESETLGDSEAELICLANGDSDVESAVPEDLDEYEDDFVLQDDEAELGAPAELQSLPFEFSRHRYKRLRDHFKDVIEWMVHNKLNPAFPRNDELYLVAYSKVTDEVTGLAGSQLVSAVWNVGFRRALEARPGIEVSGYSIADGHPCDACNRSGHPASYDVRFDGEPYLLETLEPVSDSSGSESGSDEADETNGDEERGSGNVDREGHQIPDASRHFYLGRHCKAKAAIAHTLIHWRYHLNEWVIDYLRRQDMFTDTKILERERWSQKRRSKYANETVDMMDESGEIDRLWRDFNLNIKTARGHKESRW